MTKILFIANPKSYKLDKYDLESVISEVAGKYKFKWELYFTVKSDTKNSIRKKISRYEPDIVVAAGGDGTVNQVASGLIGSKIDLGIIPAGSANGLAYNLGIPLDIRMAIEIILENKAKPVDSIRINDDIFCFHLGDIGINARIVRRFEQEGSKGLTGYGKQMLKELFSGRTHFKFMLKTPSTYKKFSAEMVVIANAKSFGTGAVINPEGLMDDGEFEIVIIRPYPWWGLFYLIRMILFGKREKLKFIQLIKTKQAEMVFDKPHDLQVDGEIIKDVKSLKTEIIPSVLNIRYK